MSQGRRPSWAKRDPSLHRCQALRLGQPCGGLEEPARFAEHLREVHRIEALDPASWFGPKLAMDLPGGGEGREKAGDA